MKRLRSKPGAVRIAIIASLLFWIPMNLLSYVPGEDFCNSLAFYSERPKIEVGHPFVFAEREPDCIEVDPQADVFDYQTTYGSYRIVSGGLIADVAIWVSSALALILLLSYLQRNYVRHGWVRTTPRATIAAIVLSGSALGAASGLIPYENNTDGMHCYSIDGYDEPRGLPLLRGWPLTYYQESRPACAEYRWIESPDVCGGPCRDYPSDPAQFYAQPLLTDMMLGVGVTTAVYVAWRYCGRPKTLH